MMQCKNGNSHQTAKIEPHTTNSDISAIRAVTISSEGKLAVALRNTCVPEECSLIVSGTIPCKISSVSRLLSLVIDQLMR